MFDLEILLEDGPLLAVNKPAGLATQAPEPFESLERCVKAYLKAKHSKPGNVYLGIPHRLDRPVSGIVVFAKNSKAAARLAEQFQHREVRKIYWAVVEGELPSSSQTLTDFLAKVEGEARAEIVTEEHPRARLATLNYRKIADVGLPGRNSAAHMVEIELGTGRMHQIRAQFGSRNCPIVGDRLYGSQWTWPYPLADAKPDELRQTERILLHARSLQLKHPVRYDEVTLVANPPDWWPELPTAT